MQKLATNKSKALNNFNWSLENDLASLAPIARLQSGSQADLAAVLHAPVWQYAQSRPMMPDRCPIVAPARLRPIAVARSLPDRFQVTSTVYVLRDTVSCRLLRFRAQFTGALSSNPVYS